MITYTGLHCPKTIYGSHSWQINMYPCILYNQLQATSKLHIQLLLQKNICTCNVGKPCSPYKCCQDCKIHISGRTVYLRGRLYLLVFSYLDFEVYNYFITIYVHVFVYMQRDLLLMIDQSCGCGLICASSRFLIKIFIFSSIAGNFVIS